MFHPSPHAPVIVFPKIKSQVFKETLSFIFVLPIIINFPENFLHKECVFCNKFFDPVQSIINQIFHNYFEEIFLYWRHLFL